MDTMTSQSAQLQDDVAELEKKMSALAMAQAETAAPDRKRRAHSRNQEADSKVRLDDVSNSTAAGRCG